VTRPKTLTEREWEVVQLLIRGERTRGAAEALRISPRTVETHLASVYRKLGIGSRSELTDRFG
jgi:DNA-binding NarL/FixJ family response regulator